MEYRITEKTTLSSAEKTLRKAINPCDIIWCENEHVYAFICRFMGDINIFSLGDLRQEVNE